MRDKNPYKNGDVECPDCGKGMKFLKEKGDGYSDSHKDYSVWGCKKCHKKHTLYNDGDAKENDWGVDDDDDDDNNDEGD